MGHQSRSLLLVGLFTVAIEGLLLPRKSNIKSAVARRRNPPPLVRPLNAGVQFSEDELDVFVDWLELQRSRSVSHAPGDDGSDAPLHVLDASDEVDTALLFSGVMWRVLADVSTNCFGPDACGVIVHFPGLVGLGIEVLEIFEDMIRQVKGSPLGQDGTSLPELQRLEVSKTVVPGPAMLIRATRGRTPEEQELALARRGASIAASKNEAACQEAVRHFVQRVVVEEKACPYTKSVDVAATSLEAQGVVPGPVGYRYSPCSDMLDAVSTAWQTFAEVLSMEERNLSTVLLSLPAVATLDQGHDRFLAFCEIMSKSVLAYGTDQALGLVYFHPLYDRHLVEPRDDASYGHIPPLRWLPPMAKHP